MSPMNKQLAAASLLLLATNSAFGQNHPWNPYHGKKPTPKPIIEYPAPPLHSTEGQEIQAPIGEGWDLYTGTTGTTPSSIGDATRPNWDTRPPIQEEERGQRRFGLRSTPALPDSWFDKGEYPNGPYGTRIVRAVVTGQALRSEPLPVEIRLKDELLYWERCLIGVDEQIRIAGQRLRSIEPMKGASTEHRIAFYDVEDQLKVLYRDANEIRGFRDETRGLLDQLHRELKTVRDTVIEWQIQSPQDRTYVPKHYLQQKAFRYVQEHPEVIGKETSLRF